MAESENKAGCVGCGPDDVIIAPYGSEPSSVMLSQAPVSQEAQAASRRRVQRLAKALNNLPPGLTNEDFDRAMPSLESRLRGEFPWGGGVLEAEYSNYGAGWGSDFSNPHPSLQHDMLRSVLEPSEVVIMHRSVQHMRLQASPSGLEVTRADTSLGGVQFQQGPIRITGGEGPGSVPDYDPGIQELEKWRERQAEAARQRLREKALADEQERREREEFERRNAFEIARLRLRRDECIEKARADHAARESEIASELDDCLLIAAAAGAGGAFAGFVGAGGPKGAIGGGIIVGGSAVIACLAIASRKRMRSLLTMQAEIEQCETSYASALSQLR